MSLRPILPLLASACLLAACASEAPLAYSEVSSSSYLAPNPSDTSGRMPYRYGAQVDWASYTKIIIEPVVLYSGRDQQFGDIPQSQREELARDMQQVFTARLSKILTVTRAPAPHTLRLKLTLTGATLNTPGLATLSRFDVAGAVYNGVQTVRDGEGAFTGSVRYVVEIEDATTGKLLTAYVAKQYPKPYDIPAGVGPLAAAKVGLERGADELAELLR